MCGMLLQFCEMGTVAISLIVCQIFVLGWRRAVWDINEWRIFPMMQQSIANTDCDS